MIFISDLQNSVTDLVETLKDSLMSPGAGWSGAV